MAMSPHTRASYGKRLAGVMLAAGLVMPATQTDTSETRGTKLGHTRISVHRNDDGTLKRGPRNQVETSNWSGYAIANFSTGELYTAAQANWTVPKVSYEPPPAVCHLVYRRGRTSKS